MHLTSEMNLSGVSTLITSRRRTRAEDFSGVLSHYHDAVTDRNNLNRLICCPSSATLADGRSAFVAWAQANRDNKETMSELAVIGVVRALADKYPCPK